MIEPLTALTGAQVFDGVEFLPDHALLIRGQDCAGIVPLQDVPAQTALTRLDSGYLVPGFVDLQVNGGGGVMFNNTPDVATLRLMAAAHARIGATSILPTLITDSADHARRAINAVVQAITAAVPGIIGLHLEGPHLSQARRGAHEGKLIRAMRDEDITTLLEAAQQLPVLKVTFAPESVSLDQIRVLSDAGILLSLGHTEAGFETCKAAVKAGARCVTHLFNAQSQIGNREPGTVGAALTLGDLSAGLIADGVHVHPASMQIALRAKVGPGQIFLISDAMATAGSKIDHFTLNGRDIRLAGNRLTLADGTLAGAHLDLAAAVRNITNLCGVSLEKALSMASRIPAELAGAHNIGTLKTGSQADVLHLTSSLEIQQVWQLGRSLLTNPG